MTDNQKRSIQIALRFCRENITLPKKGAMDYDDVAGQIAALPNAAEIKSFVAWVLAYENYEETP